MAPLQAVPEPICLFPEHVSPARETIKMPWTHRMSTSKPTYVKSLDNKPLLEVEQALFSNTYRRWILDKSGKRLCSVTRDPWSSSWKFVVADPMGKQIMKVKLLDLYGYKLEGTFTSKSGKQEILKLKEGGNFSKYHGAIISETHKEMMVVSPNEDVKDPDMMRGLDIAPGMDLVVVTAMYLCRDIMKIKKFRGGAGALAGIY